MKLLLMGCGNMGSAMLRGWLNQGILPTNVTVLDPRPNDFARSLLPIGLRLNPEQLEKPDIVVLAVKPQTIEAAKATLKRVACDGTVFISVVAGTTLQTLTV